MAVGGAELESREGAWPLWRGTNHASVTTAVGVLAGCLLRLTMYFQNRPLWLDEQSVALNMGARSVRAVLQPLDYGQGAPPLYLLATKAATAAFGVNELALRLPALLAGIALLLTTPAIARRVAGERAAAAAAWLTALSPLLLYYSNEVKQYGPEAFVASLLVLAALPMTNRATTRAQRVTLTVGGVVACWASLTSIFVLGAIGLVWLYRAITRSDRRERLWVVSTAVAWLGSFGAAYLVSYRAIARLPYMIGFWQDAYLSADLRSLQSRMPEVLGALPSAAFLHRDLFLHLPSPARYAAILVALVLAVLGMRTLWRQASWPIVVLLAGPLALAFGAYLARQYPFTARLLCFAVPGLVVLVAVGFAAHTRGWSSPLLVIVSALALLPAGYHAVLDLREPWRSHPLERPVIAALGKRLAVRPDPVYVTERALQSWLYYTTNWDHPDSSRLQFGASAWRANVASTLSRRDDSAATEVGTAPSWLQYEASGRVELLAAPSGIHAIFSGDNIGSVNPSWAMREAARLRAAARPCVWLYSTNSVLAETEALRAAVVRAGGHVAWAITAPGASARRICFTQS